MTLLPLAHQGGDLCEEGAKLDLDVRLFSYPRRIRVFYCERCQHAETIKKEPSAA
jgi:hypothetical protein